MTRRNIILLGAALLILVLGFFAYGSTLPEETQHAKTYHIGILVRGSGYDPAVDGFKKRMSELGYEEGSTITYDVRFVSDKNKLQDAVREFVSSGADLIHTYSTPATEAAIAVTKTMAHPTPIVFGSVGDPLLLSAVRSIEHPGANVTGVASLSTDLTAKRLQLLKEMDPRISRVAMPRTAEEAGDRAANKSVAIAQQAAQDLGIALTLYPVKTQQDNDVVAKKIRRNDTDGMIVGGDSLVWGSLDTYIGQQVAEKIPLAAFSLSQVEQGALMGIGPDLAVSGRQSAEIANKILRGSDPADIPVQVPEKLVFAINMDTARKIGIAFDPAFLRKADVQIKGTQ